MTGKNIKKVKKALKNMPKVKASDDFIEKVWEKAENADRPEYDQVDFDNGNVTIAKGNDWRLDVTPMGWSVWIGLLWVLLSMPLWLGLWNNLTDFGDYNEIYQGGVEIIEQVKDVEVPEIIIPKVLEVPEIEELKDLLQDNTGYIEDLGDGQFIWEAQVDFNKAFKLARMYLGPNDIFTWQGNDYTTMYIEEVSINQ